MQQDEDISGALVLLAAELGSRVRGTGNKLLVEFGGVSLVQRAATAVL